MIFFHCKKSTKHLNTLATWMSLSIYISHPYNSKSTPLTTDENLSAWDGLEMQFPSASWLSKVWTVLWLCSVKLYIIWYYDIFDNVCSKCESFRGYATITTNPSWIYNTFSQRDSRISTTVKFLKSASS